MQQGFSSYKQEIFKRFYAAIIQFGLVFKRNMFVLFVFSQLLNVELVCATTCSVW